MRRGLKILGGLLAAGIATAALLPWWLPLALRPLARSQSVTFQNYERVGYGRFRLIGVRRESPGVVFSAARIEIDTPLLWAWRSLRHLDAALSADDWKLEIAAPDPSLPKTTDSTNATTVHALARKLSASLSRWLPQAVLHRGEIRIAAAPPIAIAETDWQRGTLSAHGILIAGRDGEASVRSVDGGAINLHAESARDQTALDLVWSGADIHGSGTWRGQPLRFQARFSDRGWMPAKAEISAENWSLPATSARMGQGYGQLRGSGKLLWHDARFDFTAELHAAPKEGSRAPPVRAQVAAHGDRASVTFTTVDVNAPFAEAKLSGPLTIGFAGPSPATAARLTLRADLAKQSWFDASGVVDGSIEVRAAAGEASETFQLTCNNLQLFHYAFRRVAAQGVLQWPRLEAQKVEVSLDATSHFTAHGTLDLAQHTLTDVVLDGNFTPAWFQTWLPSALGWESAEVSATLSGPFAAPVHQGSARFAKFHRPPLQPIDGSLDWRGRGSALEDFNATFTAGTSTLHLAGALGVSKVQLRELHLQQDGAEVLQLSAPVAIAWAPFWQIDPLRLDGPNGHIALSATGGATKPSFKVEATDVDSAWSRDWIAPSGPPWKASSLKAEGQVENGDLRFALSLAARIAVAPAAALLALEARGDAKGVQLTRLEVRDESGTLAQAHGRLPVFWSADRSPRLRIEADGALQFEAETQPDSPLWAALATSLGLTLSAPRVHLRIDGTPGKPSGELELEVQRIAMADPGQKARLPALDNLNVHIHADRSSLVVDSLAAAVEGQSIRANGRCPMDTDRWQQLVTAPALFAWKEVEAEAEIPDANLQPLAAGRPAFPLAQGRLHLVAKLTRGGNLSGSLKLTDAITRPVATLGVFQHLGAELELKGRSVAVRSFSAELGGEPLTLQGSADLTQFAEPVVDFQLSGKNLPLVRKAGLLIRSDLQLAAKTNPGGETRITGVLTLHDSLVLADLRQLLPTGVRAAEHAPPYFAVEVEPFRRWLLDVEVRGPRGVRLHTPVLTGYASPRLHLTGTLGEPRAVGEVGLEGGKLLFPFTTFDVQFAVVRLSQADPFHPQLNLDASARRYGYDLRLQGRGPVDQPILTLSSNPALSTEQVSLLVMTGQAPSDSGSSPSASGDRKRLTVLGAYLGRGLFRGLGGDDPDRLTIMSGEQVTQQGGDTYTVEYKLNPRWSLVGEYDEFDDYNVGVKWRIYSEGGRDDKK